MAKTHQITAVVEGQQIDGFISGNVESSIVTAADKFVVRMPLTKAAWDTMRRGARITLLSDGVHMIDGFIDRRTPRGRDDVFEVEGRDRVGRLCDESAPTIAYSGMTILESIRRLASPWFEPKNVVISNARNRLVRRGKGRRVAADTEPVVTFNVKVPRRGNVHPGERRWQLIHEIASRAGLIVFASCDGRELIVGKANQAQTPQYEFVFAEPGSRLQHNVRDMTITEDDGDRYSMYMCGGVGGQSDTNYGKNVVDNRGVVFDNIFNRIDGTGRDFIHPKRMYLPERAFESYDDAQRVARNEQIRRDYKRHVLSVEAHTFGQDQGATEPTMFAIDTVAHVVWEKLGIDDTYYIVSCSYSFNRDNGDFTTLHMVPTGTEIIL